MGNCSCVFKCIKLWVYLVRVTDVNIEQLQMFGIKDIWVLALEQPEHHS